MLSVQRAFSGLSVKSEPPGDIRQTEIDGTKGLPESNKTQYRPQKRKENKRIIGAVNQSISILQPLW